jgi:hypothetical protein
MKIRIYCDCSVAALFVLKNGFFDHHDDRLSSNLLISWIELRFTDLIDDLRIIDALTVHYLASNLIEVIFRLHWSIGICHSVTSQSRMLRLGYRTLMFIHLIYSRVAETNARLSAFARVFVHWSSSPSS